jgi:hypothetical protein
LTPAATGPARLRTGVLLALAYAAVTVVYVRHGGNARPLFDGFAPPPPYNWVNPPKEFAAGNVQPKPSSVEIALGPGGSAVGGGSSPDGQVILSFKAGAIPPRDADTRVVVQVTPVDPAVVAAPPPGLAADGNAYRLDFTYQPSGQSVPSLAEPADVFLVVPEPAQTLLFSRDGRTWENLPFRPVADPTQIGGAFPGPGYLLAVAPPVGRPSESDSDNASVGLIGALALIAGLAGVLWLAPLAWSRLRSRS